MDHTPFATHFVLMKDLESYYKSMVNKSSRINMRVLGKIEKFVPKQTICNYIKEHPNSSEKDFWKALLINEPNEKKAEFDSIYGIITHNNDLFLIDAEHILMHSSAKEGGVYIFIGEVEEVKFGLLIKLVLKPKIALKADNLNLQLFEEVIKLFKAKRVK